MEESILGEARQQVGGHEMKRKSRWRTKEAILNSSNLTFTRVLETGVRVAWICTAQEGREPNLQPG